MFILFKNPYNSTSVPRDVEHGEAGNGAKGEGAIHRQHAQQRLYAVKYTSRTLTCMW